MIRTSLPIVRQTQVELDAGTHRRLDDLAKRLLADEPTLNRVDMFGERVRAGLSDAPAVFYEDQSEIPLFRGAVDTALSYRSFLLAGEDDIFLLGGQRVPEFESYCHDVLGLGAATVLQPELAPDMRVPLALRCARDEAVLKRLCEAAALQDELNIVPYMGTGNAWRLAAAIAVQSGAEVCVAAPPPRLTRRVNDKLWFFERVREALDGKASPLTYSVFGPAALAARLRALALRSPRVTVKIPDSAGSLGNVMIHSETIAGKPLGLIRENILDILGERGWQGTYPLMVGVWDYPVIESPSVNIWIPEREEGAPIIEGLFTQALRGAEAAFIGAEPAELPEPLAERILREAVCLAHYFQNLGYFGQCGLDAILVGDALESASIHWIECNGRWGGISIPITLANRLVGDWTEKSIIIVQRSNLDLPLRTFGAVLDRLKGHLFGFGGLREGVVLLAPGRLLHGSGLNLLVIADTKARAWAELQAVTRLLETDGAEPA